MQVLILGAGGVGGYFGGRLAQSGNPVTFLVRPNRAQQLRTQGLTLRSHFGDWAGPVRVIGKDDQAAGLFDVVIIACKTDAAAQAIPDVRPFVTSGTRVLPFCNGMGHMDVLQQAFPGQLVGGLAHLMVSVDDSGAIVHGNQVHSFRFGRLDGAADEVLTALERQLKEVPIDAQATGHILSDMWSKFQFIAGFDAATCVLRASAGVIEATDDGAALTKEVLAEAAAVAAAEGYPVSDQHFSETLALATQRGSGFTSSMLRDIRAGRATEGAGIVGDMLRRARRHKLDTPFLRVAWAHLQAYEAQRTQRGERLGRSAA